MAQETVGTPRAVQMVAAGVALLGILNIVRLVVQTALTFTGGGWPTGGRTMFLALNAIPLALSVFYVFLAFQLTRGRSWAWIAAIVLATLTTVVGAFMLLIALLGGSSPLLGLAMFAVPLAVLLGLTVPRPVRAFFARKPAPAPRPPHPAPGPWTP
ncbi:hypothetical protein [Actinoplanes utahensis]|uniref:Uncharacterized protein n=1 Tax=Actinoplanes utahensis TaxID=1869 RepID=A0A0A6UJJ1_ACTUT|nr:hypothetical protein [Actinoplanes utahensis]KHD75621.1 hypothetical protein MB27_21625 [Actinoplanes utahensis]GIF27147.1 hypothetical protein Aut01nite_01330 [Actinoplanes utahensis]